HDAGGPTPSDRACVEGTLQSSLYLGTATQMVVALPREVVLTVLVPNADEAERHRLPNPGEPVRLAWASEHMHLVREAEGGAHDGEPDNQDTLPAAPADEEERVT
ncbi:MAG TPA: TOBE domain-containing protein, partial [Thermoleophilaceae bacterium]|nr:TOBE domain-containing protein [Thermoleophilaceae bacterium]